MAIAINGARYLAHIKSTGVRFDRTVTVGHQGLFAPPVLLRGILESSGVMKGAGPNGAPEPWTEDWSDAYFQKLGVTKLEVMDASTYEGATIVHDLNQPVPPALVEAFDVVVDAGSLEHVFDVRTAVENYLRMVKVGGSVVLLDMPATNLCGHGFYQFSPEFFCEVFAPKHGFELVSLAAAEETAFAPFYEVARPRQVKRRVELMHKTPCHFFVHGRKVAPFAGFRKAVVQSDYEQAWSRPTQARAGVTPAGVADRLRRLWRRFDPKGYWIFSTRRNATRTHATKTLGEGVDFVRQQY